MCIVLPGVWMVLCKSNGFIVQTLLTLATQSTASNPYATLSSRILDATPGTIPHTSQLLSFSFRRWHWQQQLLSMEVSRLHVIILPLHI
jgi:hypothetical protein